MENSVGNSDITVKRTQQLNAGAKIPSSNFKNDRKEPFDAVLHNIGNKEQTTANCKTSSVWKEYTIKPGDTLWDLAVKKFHVGVEVLVKDNNIKDPRKLRPGQKIKIRLPAQTQQTVAVNPDGVGKPDKLDESISSSRESTDWKVYTIKPGDTLWDLAVKRFHVSVDDLIKDNEIKDPGKLKPGRQIRVRMPAPVQETLVTSRGEDNSQAGSMAADSLSQGVMVHGDPPLKSQVELKESEPIIIPPIEVGIAEQSPILDKETYQAPAVANYKFDDVNMGEKTPIDLSLKTQVQLSESESDLHRDSAVKEREPYLIRSSAYQPDEPDLKNSLMKTGLGRLITRIFGL